MANEKKITPGRAAPKKEKMRVWFWYWPNQLDQVGRKGACGFVYPTCPIKDEYTAGAILMTADAYEAMPAPRRAPKSLPPPSPLKQRKAK